MLFAHYSAELARFRQGRSYYTENRFGHVTFIDLKKTLNSKKRTMGCNERKGIPRRLINAVKNLIKIT